MLYSSEDQFYRKSISFLFCQKIKIKLDVLGNDNIVPTGYALKIVTGFARQDLKSIVRF